MGKYDVDLSMHKCPHCGLYFKGYDIDRHLGPCEEKYNRDTENPDD